MSAEKLYTPELLALTLELGEHPFDESMPHHGRARSPSCGSTLAMGLAMDEGRAVSQFGMRVQACAVGQAAAAIFARHVTGRDPEQLAEALTAMEAWLEGTDGQPAWPDLAMLEPARAFKGRHGAILLPWRAAVDALSAPPASR